MVASIMRPKALCKLVAAAVVLAGAGSVHANVPAVTSAVNLGNVNAGFSFSQQVSSTNPLSDPLFSVGNFRDVYNFTLGGGVTNLSIAANAGSNVSGFGIALVNGSNLGGSVWTPVYGQGSFSNLTQGDYSIKIWGFADPASAGQYQLSVAAVPEPEQWAMFMAGLGMMGIMAKRRSKQIKKDV